MAILSKGCIIIQLLGLIARSCMIRNEAYSEYYLPLSSYFSAMRYFASNTAFKSYVRFDKLPLLSSIRDCFFTRSAALRRAFLFVFMFQQNALGQDSSKIQKGFIGYETLEMSMNRFQNFAREVGYRINPKNQVQIAIGEVKLTEQHLSSKWQAAAGANLK